jgi:hypothetical protein
VLEQSPHAACVELLTQTRRGQNFYLKQYVTPQRVHEASLTQIVDSNLASVNQNLSLTVRILLANYFNR